MSLLNGSALGDGRARLAAVIYLCNRDEIQKGEKKRSEGTKFFYSPLVGENGYIQGGNDGATATTATATRLINIPILQNVDAFWDETIRRMDPTERMKATLQTAFQRGALDRAAARNLERGGPAALYTVMMTTATRPIGSALEACVEEATRGPVLFHCQKGKDRTGVLAMLLQSFLGESEAEIIKAYSLSGELLGGEDAPSDESKNSKTAGSAGGTIDWSHFRGSPPAAMEETMEWITQRHGSMEAYLEIVAFGETQRQGLREILELPQ
jgi:hypothetical protein